MKKTICLILSISILFTALILFVACEDEDKNVLSGNYSHSDGTTIHFSENGDFYYTSAPEIGGSYEIFDGSKGTLHFTDDFLGEWETMTFSVSKDKTQIEIEGLIYSKK